MKTWLQSILLLRNDKQQVVTNGYPYLRVDSIVGCTVKGLDVQVLIERIKFHIAFIHKIVGICHDRYLIHNLGIMNRGLCKADKYRNGSFQVHQGVHFKVALAVMESCPWQWCYCQKRKPFHQGQS